LTPFSSFPTGASHSSAESSCKNCASSASDDQPVEGPALPPEPPFSNDENGIKRRREGPSTPPPPRSPNGSPLPSPPRSKRRDHERGRERKRRRRSRSRSTDRLLDVKAPRNYDGDKTYDSEDNSKPYSKISSKSKVSIASQDIPSD